VREPLPDCLPIVAERRRAADYRARYEEPQVSRAVDLCDARGRLNRDAVGWSRSPLVRANLRGHWPRKKRWNFWNWISPQFVLQATLADIDYAAFCQVWFADFASKRTAQATGIALPGRLRMPEQVTDSIAFSGRGLTYSNTYAGGERHIALRAGLGGGEQLDADFVVRTPPGHESLNIVVPWSDRRFQLNCKENTLPCVGTLRVGAAHYALEPETCHGVQDFGRGLWPYRSWWNWGAGSGMQDGRSVGINVGARWTTATGVNENALCIDGRLHKVMEDLRWRYDREDWMRPWQVVAEHSGMLDLTFDPLLAHRVSTGMGPLRSGGVCCFGHWRGTLRVAGEELQIRDLIGWAEEFNHRW
jgi:hypothetical protein